MRLTHKLFLVAIGVLAILGFAYGNSQAQTVCCENTTPFHQSGVGDGLGIHPPPVPADLVTGQPPTSPGCTIEPTVADYWSYNGIQTAYPSPPALCTGPD
ncbi:MAG: hypothetical protein ACE5FC_04470, partial [Myxococcota bacterium]